MLGQRLNQNGEYCQRNNREVYRRVTTKTLNLKGVFDTIPHNIYLRNRLRILDEDDY